MGMPLSSMWNGERLSLLLSCYANCQYHHQCLCNSLEPSLWGECRA